MNKKTGRPTKYSKALAERLCMDLMNGSTLKQAAQKEGIHRCTILDWVEKYPEFSDMYARARNIGYELLADELLELSDESADVALVEGSGGASVSAKRLQIDTRKWILCKMLPKKYGDKQFIEATGKDGGPIESKTIFDVPPHLEEAIIKIEEIRKKRLKEEYGGESP